MVLKVTMMSPIGKRDRRSPGFTLIELFLAMVMISGCLVSIVASLAGLSRFLARTEVEAQALALASGKILEWEEMLRAGNDPGQFPSSGRFESYPEFRWEATSSPVKIPMRLGDISGSPQELNDLYQLHFQIFRNSRSVLTLGAQGWQREIEMEEEAT